MAEVSGEGSNFCVSFADCNAQSSRAERTGVLRQSQVQNIRFSHALCSTVRRMTVQLKILKSQNVSHDVSGGKY